jgi:hypothetical protein
MLLLVACMTLTSCLNSSDSDYTPTGYGIAEVINSMGTVYFKSSNGILIYPTAESLANVESSYKFNPSTTGVAYIGYEYSADDYSSSIASGSVSVTLTYAVSVDATTEIVEEQGAGEPNDSIATMPIVSLNNVMESSSSNKMTVVNNRYLVTGIQYYMYNYMHYLTLVYYEDEQDDDTVLKLHLRNSGGVESTSITYTSYDWSTSGYVYTYIKAYDLYNFPMSADVKSVQVSADVALTNETIGYSSKETYTVPFSY